MDPYLEPPSSSNFFSYLDFPVEHNLNHIPFEPFQPPLFYHELCPVSGRTERNESSFQAQFPQKRRRSRERRGDEKHEVCRVQPPSPKRRKREYRNR